MNVKKNMISNLLLTISKFIFPLITFPYITRTISNTSLGGIFYVDACTQYFILFSCLGIPAYAVREIAKIRHLPKQYSKLVMELMLIQLSLSLIFSFIFLSMPLWVTNLNNYTELVRISCISIIGTSFLMEWFYMAMEKYTYIIIRSTLLRALSVIGILVFVKKPNDYLVYYSIPILITLLNSVINFYNYIKSYHVNPTQKLQPFIHLKPLLTLFSINISVSVYTLTDTILLGYLTDPVNVSFYNVPLKFVKMIWLAAASLGIVFVPTIARLYKENREKQITPILHKSLSIIFLITIPFAFFCITLPKEILYTLSGIKYINAYHSLQILSVIPLIIGVCNVFGTQFLMPAGYEKHILHATIAGLITSLLLNFLLIPYWGYLGTSLACVISELIVCIYIYISAKRIIKITIDWNLLALVFLNSLITTVITKILSSFLQNQLLIFTSILVFALCFLVSQFVYFQNKFIFSLMKAKLSDE